MRLGDIVDTRLSLQILIEGHVSGRELCPRWIRRVNGCWNIIQVNGDELEGRKQM